MVLSESNNANGREPVGDSAKEPWESVKSVALVRI